MTEEKSHNDTAAASDSAQTPWPKCLSILLYTPKRCRWDPENPPKFNLALNLLFGVAACVTVSCLYYTHPILNILAEDFGVSYEEASVIPTVSQAGYAGGLLLICPLGDLFRRRFLVLSLVWFTATVWIGLCVTRSYAAFCAISFIVGFTTVTPQLMLPLAGQLAPANRRATALSIVVSGLLLGMLVARVLSGIVAEYTSWRVVFWVAFALQYLVLILLWMYIPDYPSSNPGGLNYFKMLWSILVLLRNEPLLVQVCLIGFCTSATFTSFWTTLTFLLAGDPYHYSSLIIGCFAFLGISAMLLGPPISRFFVDRFHHQLSVIIGESICVVSNAIGAYMGKITVAGPVIQALGMDIGIQTAQIANRTAIYAIDSKAQNRINTAYMVSVFLGQVTGTAVGNRIYAEAGWVGSGSFNVASIAAAIFFCLLRGPKEKGWIGWHGGLSLKRQDLNDSPDEEKGSSENKDGDKIATGTGQRNRHDAESGRQLSDGEKTEVPSPEPGATETASQEASESKNVEAED
jgi:predicted MFS family arabinose efflux permease